MEPHSKQILITWASTKPKIKRLWVFGSRARGDHRSDSDLDIAIELRGSGRETPFTQFMFNRDEWRKDLQRHFEIKTHLCRYEEVGYVDIDEPESNVVKAVQKDGILIYDSTDAQNAIS